MALRGLLLVGWSCTSALARGSEEAPSDLWSAGVGVDRIAWLASVAWFGSKAQGVWVRRQLPTLLTGDQPGGGPLDVGLEARALSTPLISDGAGFEVGGSLGYGPRTGGYRPRVAVTAGWSGGVRFDWADYHGDGWQEQSPVSRADYWPWYCGVMVEPLAGQLGPFYASLAGLGVTQLGRSRVLRIQVQAVSVGAVW